MADKSIDQLNAAERVYSTDLFVLQQSGSAKKLTGQVLLNWLTAAADGHGGIKSIEKLSTSGLVDTYRITLADTTTFDFVVNNGRGITGVSKTSTSGLVDTYTISYNNGTTSTFTVTNGAKGDKGDNAYIWIKYASQEPTESSHSIGDIPDNWIGIYAGNASAAPSDWTLYKWYQYKGDKGDKGDAATLASKSVTYQVGDSGTVEPSGSWLTDVPSVPQGKYLWTRTVVRFNTGDPITWYSVAYAGINGTGAVSTVNGVNPDETGNVTLGASDVGALPVSGGDMTGAINMRGQPISGLNDPTEDTQAANKVYVDAAATAANAYTDAAKAEAKAYTDTAKEEANSYTDSRHITKTATITTTWTGSGPYTQSVTVSGILSTDTPHITPVYSTTNATAIAQKEAWACVSKAETSADTITFTCFEEKPTTEIAVLIEVLR